MKKNKLFQRILVNYVVFLILRYANIIIGFGLGFGAAPHYQKWYVDWIHLPSLLIHLVFLFYLERRWPKAQVTIIALILLVMFSVGQFILGNVVLLPK